MKSHGWIVGLTVILMGLALRGAEAQTASVIGVSAAITAENCGAVGNGAIDPDETVAVEFVLRNDGAADTTNVMATLLATGGVTGPDGPMSYGALLAGGAAVTNSFSFAATGECGGTLTALLSLDDNGLDLGTVPFEFTLGVEVQTSQTLTNEALITLTDAASADPFPATISISNLPGTIQQVTATLHGFAHDYPEDIDIILVSPDGDAVSLIGADGGDVAVTNLTMTFDDEASSTVGAELTSGTFLPSGTAEEMNAPAPAPPYGAAMSDFNGGMPNGTWSLYAQDVEAELFGEISSGWSLSVTAVDFECCQSGQPPIFDALDHQDVQESNLLSFAVTATDPSDGDPITLTVSNLPSGATFPTTNGLGTFIWNSASPTGTYPVTFHAVDKDGAVSTSITVRVEQPPYENTNCAVLFSEYVEGTANNKALEIYNPSLTPLNLDTEQYVVMGYQNGATAAGYTIALTGSIPAQAVFVLANSSADASVLAVADMTSGALTFNGNDAVVLRSGGASGTVLDSIGQVGFDPGIAWGTGIVSTAEHTLRRMATVEEGDTDPSDAYDPAPEWDGFSQNTFDGLGSHTSDCSGPPLPTSPLLNPVGNRLVTVSNTLQFEVVATPTDGDPVTLTATNLPAGAVFYPTNEWGTFLWTNASPTGTYSVTFTASDIDGSDEDTIQIIVGMSNAPSLVYLETFDDTSMWGGGVAGSYNAKTFDNDSTNPVADEFYSNLAVMETTYSVTSNAWRLQNVAGTYLRYGVKTNLTRIRVQLARWDNSPVMDFEIRTSTDFGTNYTTLYTTNGDWFASDKVYQEWDSGVIDLQPVDDRPVWIEIYKISGERLLVDNFQVEFTSVGTSGTPPELQSIGNQMAFLGSALSVPVSALPTDGDAVTLSVSNLPAGAEFSPTNEAGTFYWPAVSPTGLYTVTFYAADKDGSDEETLDFTIYPLPQVGAFSSSNNAPASATFQTISGQVYQMEFSLDLITAPVVWTSIVSTNGTGGSMTLSDTNNGSDVKRYYRISVP
jgi:Lamin Tail Domain/Bacterial Ig domain